MSLLVVPGKFAVPYKERNEKLHLYSIAGWLEQISCESAATCFGGFFRYNPKEMKIVDGQIADIWGKAHIRGRMTQEKLTFTKLYDHRNDQIVYEFTRNGDLWVGKYTYPSLESLKLPEDTAQCITTKISEQGHRMIATDGRNRFSLAEN